MSIKEISKMLVRARRPIDFFGNVSKDEIASIYRKTAKMLHPDTAVFADESEKYIAIEAFKLLHQLYKSGLKEYDEGIYTIVDTISLYDKKTPIVEMDFGGKVYKFYEHFCDGEIAHIHKGTNGEYIVYLKTAIDPIDNDLISNEFDLLNSLNHHSLPVVEKKVMVNDSMAFIMREAEGLQMPELLNNFDNSIPAEHVMWMLERLFSVTGYLHSNKIVHGNIRPENIIINPNNHNVSLLGFSMAIKDANTPSARYKVINEYTAPEVNKNTRVLPNADIYSIGKVAIELLGGNIENNGMPLSVEGEVRDFIRKLVNPSSTRSNDAWGLWNEVIELRNKIYGTERFKKLEKRK